MSKRFVRLVVTFAGAMFLSLSALAQDNGTYSGFSPYSVYGVGISSQSGTAYNQSMGGVGIANRNKRYINVMNPASITERDSLSFMADFGLSGRASIFNDGQYRTGNNLFNISDFVISFPLYKKSAFMVGVMPYSDVGYQFSSKDSSTDIIAENGIKTSTADGEGSIYQLFAGGSVLLWNRLSLGAQYIYYFGDINRRFSETYSNVDVLGHVQNHEFQLSGHTAKLGLQYTQPFGSNLLTFGATYRFGAPMNGYNNYSIARIISGSEESADETETSLSGLRFGSEAGFGLAFNMSDKYRFEIDYTLSDNRLCGFDAIDGMKNENFASNIGHSFAAGVEYTPNRNDIRYYMKRVSYRAGAYYNMQNYRVNGLPVNDIGISVGATFPVFRWYNGLTVGLQAGQRGTVSSGLVRERYFGFSLGVNIFDIWFQKPRYD